MPRSREERSMEAKGEAKVFEHFLSMIAGNLSGPTAEYVPILAMAVMMSSSKKVMSSNEILLPFLGDFLGRGGYSFLGLLKALEYWVLSNSLITLGSDWRPPSPSLSGPIPSLVFWNFFV